MSLIENRIPLIKRNIIVLDRLLMLHNRILSTKTGYDIANVWKRTKQHELSFVLGCIILIAQL